jgi:hypothetical protein
MLIFRRQIKLSLRNPAWVIIGLIQPILYLAFFGPLLSKVAEGRWPASRPATPTASSFPACSSSSACSAPRSSDSRSSPTGATG